jgi:hypothetical protein
MVVIMMNLFHRIGICMLKGPKYADDARFKESFLVFWVVTPCRLMGDYQHFEGTRN